MGVAGYPLTTLTSCVRNELLEEMRSVDALYVHAKNAGEMLVAIGRILGMSEAEIDTLHLGATLHDVGKLVLPKDHLQKQAALLLESAAFYSNTCPWESPFSRNATQGSYNRGPWRWWDCTTSSPTATATPTVSGKFRSRSSSCGGCLRGVDRRPPLPQGFV